ncbi:MAG: sigma-E factor negative regulatory protein [Betaproteobacteria bacterium]
MKTEISALVDGELDGREAAGPLNAIKEEGELRDRWRSYHLIGDAMRDTRMVTPGFAVRVAAKLAQEPTVMAPARRVPLPQRPRWQYLSAAASVAAVALVGWIAFAPQEAAPPVAIAPKQSEIVQVAPPDKADDYLYAHQGYSPRNSLQGVAPYVRMVSGEAGAGKR